MFRIAFLLFGLVATVFAGIAIVVVLMTPAWQAEAAKYIVGAIALGAVLAIPASLFIARQIASFSGKSAEETVAPANLGGLDRILRIVAGMVLIAYAIPLGFSVTGWNAVGWIGVVPLLTALIGFCPAYTILGVNTCPRGPAA